MTIELQGYLIPLFSKKLVTITATTLIVSTGVVYASNHKHAIGYGGGIYASYRCDFVAAEYWM
ncbi:hypothetical protein ACVBE9_00795 [Eionea flava]